ncbi:MAG: ABC transporter permease [Dehalococcoidia bacterium]|nr:ABC transporter permease [Dehalococcoidia bacterium]
MKTPVLPLLIIANLKMSVRNRQALFWAMFFPLIFVGVFGLFNLDELPTTSIGVIDYAQDGVSAALVRDLESVDNVKVKPRTDEALARQEIKDKKLKLLLVLPAGLERSVQQRAPVGIQLVFDESDPVAAAGVSVVRRFLAQENLRFTQAPSVLAIASEGIRTNKTDYFDFLLPGFIGMGVMTYSIIGLASMLAVYREQKIFKRVLATPLRVSTFFTAIVAALLVIAVAQAAVILLTGIFLLGGHVYGNYLYIGVLVLLGNSVFLAIGFIVGAHVNTVQAASGLGNAVAMPMMVLSGTFFPTETLPPILENIVAYLPLAAMLDALRGVTLDGQPLWHFGKELGILAAWLVGTFVIAVRSFKFR